MDQQIQIHDKTFELYITEEKIQQSILALAKQINETYKNQKVHFVIVLNGAFMFAADLLKQITLPCEISFVRIKSYQGMKSDGKIQELLGMTEDLSGKNVLIIEDIVDTGLSINFLYDHLLKEKPLTLDSVTLFFKPNAFQGLKTPQFIGFSISNEFIVGYGLDYLEEGRNLKNIYQYKAN